MRIRSFKLGVLSTLLVLGVVVLVGCSAQENNTYPVDVFVEMHYSPAVRNNEPARYDPSGADPVVSLGAPADVLMVPAENRRPYVIANARELYRINCSNCHGMGGLGDGPVADYIVADDSFYASVNGVAYEAPPNLRESRQTLTPESAYQIIVNGVNVMPAFRNLLAEEDIREIVEYVFDEQAGLGS